jgi:hypothetical protein
LSEFGRKLLWLRIAEIDTFFAHRIHDYGMNVLCGVGTGRNGSRQFGIGELVKECRLADSPATWPKTAKPSP